MKSTNKKAGPGIVLVKSNKRKMEIVNKTAALFIKKGYPGTSVRDIAAECDMNLATLYHYVGSKENILSLYLDSVTESMSQFTRDALPMLQHIPPREALSKAIEMYLKYCDELQDVIVFWHQESRNLKPEKLGRLISQEIQLADMLKSILTWGVRSGDFTIKDLDVQAHSIIVLCDTWCLRRWYFRHKYSLKQYTELITDIILKGVTSQK